MVIALFSREINDSTKNVINSFFSSKHAKQSKFFIEKNILDGLENIENLNLVPFETSNDLNSSIEIMLSIGGDGTFLRSIEFVRDLDIPVLGINTGNLGFLATSKNINEHMIQTSGAFRYTTALAHPLAAAALAALKLIQLNPSWVTQLQKKSIEWRERLLNEGWHIPSGIGPIIPLILGSDEKSLKKQQQLEANGLLTIAIRPPTVPEGTSRLRNVLRNNLPENTLEKLIFNLRDKC